MAPSRGRFTSVVGDSEGSDFTIISRVSLRFHDVSLATPPSSTLYYLIRLKATVRPVTPCKGKHVYHEFAWYYHGPGLMLFIEDYGK